jgi:serine/threonine-protein kinase HipA
MALTLNGTTQWPSAKELQRLGEIRMGASPARVREILERVRDAVARTSGDIQSYMKKHSDFDEIGGRMMLEWQEGSDRSLRG